jgi:hypothetical protein
MVVEQGHREEVLEILVHSHRAAGAAVAAAAFQDLQGQQEAPRVARPEQAAQAEMEGCL